MSGLDYERVVLAGGPLGLMAAASIWCALRAGAKAVRKPSDFRAHASEGGDMYAPQCEPCVCLLRGTRVRCGKAKRRDAASCILFAAEHATQAALEAIQALGGNGYTNDYAAAGCCAMRAL